MAEQTRLVWTDDIPLEEKWYWIKLKDSDEKVIAELFDTLDGILFYWSNEQCETSDISRYAGPVQKPTDSMWMPDYPGIRGWYWIEFVSHDRIIACLPADEEQIGDFWVGGRFYTGTDIVYYAGPILEPNEPESAETN